jgi:hypothetical protein
MVAAMARRVVVAVVLALFLALAAAPAQGATAQGATAQTPWATVNVCDTKAHPNTIGIRALIPGAKRKRVRLFMRFRVQWKDRTDGLWHNLIDQGDSGFVGFGRSKKGLGREGGRLFPFKEPRKPLRLRGRVDFEWRIGKHVVKRDSELTEKGHRSGAGSDPKGYSAATCLLR